MDELNLRPPNTNPSVGGEEKTVFAIFPSITKDMSDVKLSFQGLQIKLLYPLPAFCFHSSSFCSKIMLGRVLHYNRGAGKGEGWGGGGGG